MRINNTGIDTSRADVTKSVESVRSGPGKRASAGETASNQRGDSVQISDAGRALASQQAESVRAELTPERIGEFRQKILQGAYNSVEVVEEVARRMLERGDI